MQQGHRWQLIKGTTFFTVVTVPHKFAKKGLALLYILIVAHLLLQLLVNPGVPQVYHPPFLTAAVLS